MIDDLKLFGLDDSDIDFNNCERPIHNKLLPALLELKYAAKLNGFNLQVVSGYRSFDRQLDIWNEKAKGMRPVLDANEYPLIVNRLSKRDLVLAILRWSALPGTSRHHWGTEIDVIDAAVLDKGQSFELTMQETQEGGIFAEFHLWLNECLNRETFGFFRPYSADCGGVSPEPWHLSYAPCANYFERLQRTDHFKLSLKTLLLERELILIEEVTEELEAIISRFVLTD